MLSSTVWVRMRLRPDKEAPLSLPYARFFAFLHESRDEPPYRCVGEDSIGMEVEAPRLRWRMSKACAVDHALDAKYEELEHSAIDEVSCVDLETSF